MRSKVAVVLATYNGAAHLEEQLESVRRQDLRDWSLFVRDDGSTDGTRRLLEELAARDARVTVLPPGPRLGAVGNFGALFAHALGAGTEYVFPCDQDDVWEPTKMSAALARMERLEAEHGRSTPLLVHSDLRVVDERLSEIAPSFLRYQGIAHEESAPLHVLLVQNYVTGCASLLNRALLELAVPIPASCIMHDWWIAQCAAARGRIGFIPEPLLRYRQHGGNEVGAGGAFGNLNPFHARGRKRFVRSWRAAVQSVWQAADLSERLRERGGASAPVLELVDGYARFNRLGAVGRLRRMRRLGIRRQRPMGTALLYVRMALLGVARDTGRS